MIDGQDTTNNEGPLLEEFQVEGTAKDRNASAFSATINLINTIVGGGILALPFAFKHTGILFGIACMISVCALSWLTGRQLITLSMHHNAFSYRDLCNIYLGSKGGILIDIFGVLFLVGACIAYMMVIGDMLVPFMDFILGRDKYNPLLWKNILIGGISIIFLYPLLWLKNMDSLKWFSGIAILCMGYLTAVISVKSVAALLAHSTSGNQFYWIHFSEKSFLAIPILNFSFTIQLNFFPIMKEMKEPENIKKSLTVSMFVCLVLYLITGCSGYINFKENANSNILTNYDDEDILIGIARVALAILLILSYAILAFPARNVIDALIFKTEAPLWRRMIESKIFVALTYLCAIAIPGIDYVFEAVGTTSGNLVMYILPGFFTLVFKMKQDGNFSPSPIRFVKNSAKLRYLPFLCLILLGIVFVILGFVSMVLQ